MRHDGADGVTAELVLWDPKTKPDVAGKIVVLRPVERPDVREAFTESDYEYKTPFDSWPAIICSPCRPGVHGASQRPRYEMGSGARFQGIPGFGVQGDLGGYWAHSGRINHFDPRSFRREVAMFCQLTGFLMRSDLSALQAPKVGRPLG